MYAYSDYSFEGVPSTPPLLLAESIRRFGGSGRDEGLWYFVRDDRDPPDELLDEAHRLGVTIGSYAPDHLLEPWPFAMKAVAAAVAEREAERRREELVWFDRDSLVTGDLVALALPPDKKIGYRPVNGRNIGSPAAEPVDEFWARAYAISGLGPDEAGTTRAYLGGEELRFYIAAGLLAMDPCLGVLRRWADLCRSFAVDGEMTRLARAEEARSIFAHQAALSLAVAASIPPGQRHEFGADLMYPLNFWGIDQGERRPATIDGLRSLRYDTVFEGPGWRDLPMSESFRNWLENRLARS